MKEYRTITWQLIFTYLSKSILVPLHILLFVILTRFLSKEEYGIVSLFFVTIMLFGKYLTLGIPEYIIKEYSGLKANIRSKRFSSIFSFELGVMIAFLIIFLFLLKPVMIYFNMQDYYLVGVFVVLTIFVFPLYSFLMNFLTAKQRIKTTEAFGLLETSWILFIILGALLYGILHLDVLFGLRFFIALGTLVCLWFFIKRRDAIRLIIPDKKELYKALIFSLPLLPLMASEYFINAGDRYLIGFFEGSAAVGSYAYFYSLLSLILAFSIIPTNMLFTYSAKAFRTSRAKANMFFNTGAKYSLLLLLPALIGLFVLQKEIVTLISGPKYLNDLYVLPFLMLFPLFEYFSHFYRRGCILLNKTKYLAVTYVCVGIINIVLNIILIPRFYLIGAAIATVISYLVLFILLFIEGKAIIKWNNDFIKIHKIIFCALIMGIIISFIRPEYAVTKILTIAFGAGIYFVLLFLSKTFVQDEIKLMKSILESRPLSERLSKKIFR